jgi:hypothetical protein
MPPGKESQRVLPSFGRGHTRRRRTTMNRRGLFWAGGLALILLLVVGAAALLTTVGAGYAKNEDASRAKCSEATLKGTYPFAFDGVEVKGNNEQAPFAIAGYAIFNGNGKEKSVVSSNFNGQVSRKEPISGTYTVKGDCTGTLTFADGSQIDLFIAPDGSMFTFVQTKPSELVGSGFQQRGTAKRVGN